jgi:ABC-2 type transport system permease protein
MTALVRVEVGKLRTLRSVWITNVVGVVASLGLSVLALAYADDDQSGLSDVMSNAGLIGMFVTVVVAIQMANEYQHRTIATAFTLVPNRLRVITSKALAAAVIGAVLGLFYLALGLLMSVIWFGGELPWTLAELLRSTLGGVVVAATMAVGGVAFGALTRSAGGAVAATIGVYVVVESLLGGFVRFYADYGISSMQLTAMNPFYEDGSYAYAPALLLNLAVALAFFAVAAATVRRVDV